jgi:WD40 repeat protein
MRLLSILACIWFIGSTSSNYAQIYEPPTLKERVVNCIVNRLLNDNADTAKKDLTALAILLPKELQVAIRERMWYSMSSLVSALFCIQLKYDRHINHVAISSDGNYLLVSYGPHSMQGIVVLIDITDVNNPKNYFLKGHPTWTSIEYSPGRNLYNGVFALQFSPDSKYALTGDREGRLIAWDITDLNNIKSYSLLGHSDYISSIAFSPNGNYVLTGSDDKTVRLWDISDLTKITSTSFIAYSDRLTSVAISPSGRYIAAGSCRGDIIIWDRIDSGNSSPYVLKGHGSPLPSIAWSPDSRYILAGSYDKTARIWDIQDIKTPQSYVLQLSESVIGVSFSADGNYALTGSYDTKIVLWDIATLSAPKSYCISKDNDDSKFAAVGFSSNSHYIASRLGSDRISIGDIKPHFSLPQMVLIAQLKNGFSFEKILSDPFYNKVLEEFSEKERETLGDHFR